ncbi:MAG TPA: 5-methyltetrahydropteroyltriglutamate--homocysteine S-methyltransferase [Paenalcaligenes sp.]|nr:5-methyltetrahydropteroyltriglutamate--homocysteine S-methyltransferase [Paenalcaligenes sp.]
MSIIHNLGFPRIGKHRELKFAVEKYWRDEITADELFTIGATLRKNHWETQRDAGIEWLTVGDFAWYDHVLELTTMLDIIPSRFESKKAQANDKTGQLNLLFALARGYDGDGEKAIASEMTKWFDTNYHYIVPELDEDQQFKLVKEDLFEQVDEAKKLHDKIKVALVGPVTFLYLSKGDAFVEGPTDEKKLQLLPGLLAAYEQIIARLKDQGVGQIQLEEPALGLKLPEAWVAAVEQSVTQLAKAEVPLLLTTYFEGVGEYAERLLKLPIAGIHLDLVRAPEQLDDFVSRLGEDQILSLGVIDGRNVWRSDVQAIADKYQDLHQQLGDRLWLAPSCSLLLSPVDLSVETLLDPELKSWLAFAEQKLEELALIKALLENNATDAQKERIADSTQALENRRTSSRIHRPEVAERFANLDQVVRQRVPFAERQKVQQADLKLPLFPTTTIGSFPQTQEVRALRRAWRDHELSDAAYQEGIQKEIAKVIQEQEALGIDMLVHGEAERNDMVEYFGELLGGYAFTQNGWVQSYGTRGVKPPIIYGDVVRVSPMTVEWAKYAQSLTDRPVKGMLTGPITMLQWSFVRDDQPREETCRQIALALRDEVLDLEAGGIKAIQVDEPAIREGLPLRKDKWAEYLEWAVDSFQITCGGVKPETQIHTHMCYSEFNDIMESIAALDADVITIETSRSNMELLDAFEDFHYPNDIGPGVYDIHSPLVPNQDWMVELMERAAKKIPVERLWVNPDCGLKTRGWDETRPALQAMVNAAKELRKRHANEQR